MSDRACKQCGRVWRTYVDVACGNPGDCSECNFAFEILGEPQTTHREIVSEDFDEVVSYSCPHGTGYDWLCRGCGSKVGGWGIGAAGFGELCGCEVPA